MDLLLIRHALPRRVELAPGERADPPLAERGHAQARALAEWLAHEPLDALYTSPLTRARETAAPVAAATGLDAVVADGVAEYDRDSHEYVPIEELKAAGDPRWRDLVDGNYFADAGLTPAGFQAGVVEALDEIIAAHRGGTVAVVCHGGVLNAWFGHVVGIEEFMIMEPTYTGINRYRCSSRGHRSIVAINETAHLRGLA